MTNNVFYYSGLTQKEQVIFSELHNIDKDLAFKYVEKIGKGSFEKPHDELFNDWETSDFLFKEPEAELVAKFINEFPENSTIVEMGVWKGWSTSLIIPKLKRDYNYICVDWFKGSPTESCDNANPDVVEKMFVDRMKEKNIFNKIKLIRGNSTVVADYFKDETIDLFFLDGAHTEPHFRNDLKAWSDKIKIGGIFSGHDWNTVGDSALSFFTIDGRFEPIYLPDEIRNKTIGSFDVSTWFFRRVK